MTNASGRPDFSALSLSYGAGEGTHTPSAAGEGTARYVVRDGVETLEQDSYTSWEESERADTARRGGDNTFQVTTQSGRVIQPGAGVSPDMLIRLPGGMQTTIANALQQGLISRNPDGSYHCDENEIGRDTTPRQVAPKKPAGEFMEDRGAEQLVNVLAAEVAPTDAMGVVNDLIEDGAVNPNLLGNVASQLGVMPHAAQAYVNRVVEGFTAQANSVVERITGGIASSEEIYSWARDNDPQALKDSMREQITARSTSGFRNLAKAYMGQLDAHQPQAVFDAAAQAGLNPTWDSRTKQVILSLPDGRTMPYRQAVMLGIINLSAVK